MKTFAAIWILVPLLVPSWGHVEKMVRPVLAPRTSLEAHSPREWVNILRKLSKFAIDWPPGGSQHQPASAGTSNMVVSAQIVGGTNTLRGQYPWTAAIILDYDWFCGGTLIHATWVLTAAHCVDGYSRFEVTLGAQNRTNNETGRVVLISNQRVIHPNYDPYSIKNDLGLIKLPKIVITPTRYINVVRLPRVSDASNSFEGKSTVVCGWGYVKDGGGLSSVLNYVTMPVISNVACTAVFGTYYVANTTICTSGVGRKSTCDADSGGPLMYLENDFKWTQIGIVSYGASTCMQPYPSAYTRVTSYLGWISNNTGIYVRP